MPLQATVIRWPSLICKRMSKAPKVQPEELTSYLYWLMLLLWPLFYCSIKVLPSTLFENLNSLETLNLQNNKLQRIPQDTMEPVIDTLRIIDITGKSLLLVEVPLTS